ncbi:unnamed protein product [Diamesa hyperborea]
MDQLMKDPLLETFLKHSGKVMEYGFAYIYAHPKHIAEMNNLLKIIKDFQAVQYRHSTVPTFCKQLIMDGYIDYIRRVTKFGFKYICNHPEVMKDIQDLSIFYNEFDKINNKRNQSQRRQFTTLPNQDYFDESEINEAGGEQFFEICFNELNQLQSIIQSFEKKMNKKMYSDYPSFTTTSKVLNDFNKKLEDELQSTQYRNGKYRQRPAPPKRNPDLVNVPNNFAAKSFVPNVSLPNLTPPTFKHKESPYCGWCNVNQDLKSQKKRTTNISNKSIPHYYLDSSSDISSLGSVIEYKSSDEIIHINNTTGNLQRIPTFKIHPPEKHIYIPIETRNNDQQYFPKITSELTFTKPNQRNQMHMNVRLGFDDGFQLQDKFINEINIHHKLPLPPRHSRIKNDIKLQN